MGAVLEPHGFSWAASWAGKSSGGYSDSGAYVRGNRRLELHAKYPCFSSDPLEAFRCLADDLRRFGDDFISGPGDTFVAAKVAANVRSKLSGLARLDET